MKMNEHAISANLTQGPIAKTLISLTSPMVWGLIAIISINLVDTFFIAKLGEDPLAAMSFSLPIIMILMNATLGLSVGTGSLISRAIGGGDLQRVKLLTSSSLILTFFSATLLALIGMYSIEPLFTLFNAPSSVLPYIHTYMFIWYLGMPAMGLAMVGNAALTSAGDIKFPAFIMIVAAILNLSLDPILIFGLFGFPRLEMQGAALATVISYSVAFCLSSWNFAIKKQMITWKIALKDLISSWKEHLLLSVPAAGSQMIVPFTAAITIWILSGFGSEVVGGFGIVSRLEAFALIVVIALSQCISPFAGQNWGAGYQKRAFEAVIFGYKFCLIWGLFVAAALALGRKYIAAFFIDDPLVISTVSSYLLIVPISYGATGCLFVANAFLNAIGKSHIVVAITFIRYFLLYLPLAIFVMPSSGVNGIFFVISFVNFLMGALVCLLIAKTQIATKPCHKRH